MKNEEIKDLDDQQSPEEILKQPMDKDNPNHDSNNSEQNNEDPKAIKNLEIQIERLKKELTESNEKNQQILRTAAHVQTMYKDMETKMPKEIIKAQNKIKNDFFHSLIKIIDMFELALHGMKDTNDQNKSIVEGIKMIYNYMSNNFKVGAMINQID